MKKYFLLFVACNLLFIFFALGQTETPVTNTTEQQIEDLTNANDDNETEDDVWLQQLEDFKKHPINLNTADEDELKQLRILLPIQINSLISYRKLLGNLLSIYELQAVPNWDIETIKKIQPFIVVSTPTSLRNTFRERLRGGDNNIVVRVSQTIEKARGFIDSTSSGNRYPGSPQRLFLRYRYSFKNLLQYGFTAEKDPGEALFKGAQKNGFDFYSFHFFASKIGKIKSLALGDFTVNMGQGLIQWQGLAFRKSAEALNIKRTSNILRPYNSAGEFNFFRGAGITLQLGKNTETTLFGSYRLRDANINIDTTVFNDDIATSLQTSGFHRTKSEIADRNALQQLAFGGNISFRKKRWHVGLNAIGYNYNKALQKAEDPYNNFAIGGNNWFNASMDYSYSYKNFHYFGETAISKNGGYAFLDGIMLTLDPKIDVGMVLRNISKKYQAVNGNAFTEGTFPTNESGFYTGVTIRPFTGIKIDAYGDFYKFPFLRYRVDAPSGGNDYLIQLAYKPNKVVDAYIRFRNETKDQNISGLELPTRPVVGLSRKNFRTHVSYKINTLLTLKQRVELVWYDRNGTQESNGFSVYTDISYKPLLKPLSANMRLQYFDTDDYNSRIYAYENDVLYSFSIPALYDKGWRYYTNINYDLTRKLSFWLRFAQTLYAEKNIIGSGLDEIKSNRKTDFRLQVRYLF
jgi:hypothetical protein